MILAIRKAAIIMEKVLHSNQSLLYIEIDGTNSSFTPWNTLYFMTSILFRDDLSCSMMGDFGQRTLEWRNILWFDGKRDQRLYIGAKEQKKQKKKHIGHWNMDKQQVEEQCLYWRVHITSKPHLWLWRDIYIHDCSDNSGKVSSHKSWIQEYLMMGCLIWELYEISDSVNSRQAASKKSCDFFFFFKQIKRILFTSPPSILVEAWNLLSHEDEKAL